MWIRALRLSAFFLVVGAKCEQLPAVCVVDKPSALPGETISVKVLMSPQIPGARYTWQSSGGRVLRTGAQVLWSLIDTNPGKQTIAAHIESDGKQLDCSARLLVVEPANERGEAGSSTLLAAQREGSGSLKYGAYTYVLLAGPAPDGATRDRYLAVLSAWQKLIPSVRSWETYTKPEQLNITFVPLDAVPAENANPEWLLDHYDYARAKLILRKFNGEQGRGPVLITSLLPLTTNDPAHGQTLLQNLSTVPAAMAGYWMESFLRQASQDRFWMRPARVNFALQMRTILESAGQTVGPVASAFADLRGLISWK